MTTIATEFFKQSSRNVKPWPFKTKPHVSDECNGKLEANGKDRVRIHDDTRVTGRTSVTVKTGK